MTKLNSTPIALPAGAFELSDLEELGRRAVKASPEEHAALVADGLADINQRVDHADVPGRLPGHRFRTVHRTLVEGTEEPVPGGKKGETETLGEVTVSERIQVFHREQADEEREASEAPAASAGAAAVPSSDARAAAASAAAGGAAA